MTFAKYRLAIYGFIRSAKPRCIVDVVGKMAALYRGAATGRIYKGLLERITVRFEVWPGESFN